MSGGKKQNPKDKQNSSILSKVPKNVFTVSTKKQPTGEKHQSLPKENEGPFEDVDLSDPPPDEPEFEFVNHRDAPHSSYNSQKDHKWKYEKDFGNDQSGSGDGKEKK